MCECSKEKGIGGNSITAHLTDWCDPHKERRTVSLDSCIAPIIKQLWKEGFETLNCCCGHGVKEFYGGGPSVIIPHHYGEIQIWEIRKCLQKNDNRKWNIFQWQVERPRKWRYGKRMKLTKV